MHLECATYAFYRLHLQKDLWHFFLPEFAFENSLYRVVSDLLILTEYLKEGGVFGDFETIGLSDGAMPEVCLLFQAVPVTINEGVDCWRFYLRLRRDLI